MQQENWLSRVIQIEGSVVPSIVNRVIGCGIFGLLVSILYQTNLQVSQPGLDKVIPSIILVLGLLLVFRTNTAYERFWEGRKCWGILNNTSRNLSRQIWISVLEKKPEDREEKQAILRLIVAFALAMKLHLRSEKINDELAALMLSSQFNKLKEIKNLPLEIAAWIGNYIQEQSERNCLNDYQVTALNNLLNNMIDSLGGCERILKTPIPLAYVIHLRQLILIFCLVLPFQIVAQTTWFTGLIVGIVSFALFGIEEIGIEIENPFGNDPNDLPLDSICDTIGKNIDDLIKLEPSVSFKSKN